MLVIAVHGAEIADDRVPWTGRRHDDDATESTGVPTAEGLFDARHDEDAGGAGGLEGLLGWERARELDVGVELDGEDLVQLRVVALEEHFSVPALVKRIDPGAISRRGYKPRKAPPARPAMPICWNSAAAAA